MQILLIDHGRSWDTGMRYQAGPIHMPFIHQAMGWSRVHHASYSPEPSRVHCPVWFHWNWEDDIVVVVVLVSGRCNAYDSTTTVTAAAILDLVLC